MAEQTKQMGIEMPAPEGQIVINTKQKDGSSSGTAKMPYAKVNGEYRILSGRYTDKMLASLRSKSNDDLLKEIFDQGIPDVETAKLRKDWATAATKLPADGGEAGKSLIARTTALYKAAQAKDPDAAVRAGSKVQTMGLAKKDYSGKPIPMKTRQLELKLSSLNWLHDVKIEAGYRLGSSVVLVIEARDGAGWIVRGPILLRKHGTQWLVARRHVVNYPDAG